ncbi:hypothetical protein [Algisphaera agarilytica]|uniref:DUF3352 domain-containing protein n=1 Tax=Algisphaera agarilytica TaxID=1385975 RepID=A0A7X0H9D3_9BACT|nr:hypothetical protein [Algisphaera agarilytica]MBB6430194.1 hypothetical protein [Algisphaera agarilytica]
MLATPRLTRTLAGVATATAVCLAGPSAWAQDAPAAAPMVTTTLDQAAEGAEIVIMIPSMSGLSEAIAGFATETGLDQVAPELDDGLGAFKRQMGWLEGVDDEGAMLVVITDLADAIDSAVQDGDKEPSAMMLVPVSDYKAFVAQLGGDPMADITSVSYDSFDGFSKEQNGYALMGETLESVQAYAAGKQGQAITKAMGPLVTEYLNGGDALIYVDMASLAPSLNLAIDRAMEEIGREMGDPNNDIPAAFKGTLDTIIRFYEAYGRTLVDGNDKVLLSADFGDGGLGLTISSMLTKDSELASYFTPTDKAGDSTNAAGLLATLPDKSYIYASSVDSTQLGINAMIEKIDEVLGGEDAGFLAMYTESFAMMKDVKGAASVFYAPNPAAMMAGGFYTSLTLYDVDDAEAFKAQNKANFEKLGGMKITLPEMEAGQGEQEITFTTTYTDKALVIEGVEVDQFQMNMNLPPAMMQQFGPMAMLMGNSGTGGYIAAKDGKVLVSTVADTQLITQGLQAIGQDDGIGSAGTIATMRDNNLPADASMEAYVSLAGIAETANPFLLMFSPNGQQLDIPADLPPLGMGGASDGEALALRMFVPHEVVKFGVDTYQEFAPAEQNQGGRDGAPRAPRAY